MSTYLDVLPKEVIYSLPYSDGSGEYIQVKFEAGKAGITIRQDSDLFHLDKTQVRWLYDVLDDIMNLTREESALKRSKEEPNDKPSVATDDASSNDADNQNS